MFTNDNFVAIFFKLINFFTLIGLAFFVFKKYLKTDILFLIAKKQTDHENLLALQSDLEKKQRELDLLLKQEALQCHDFRTKIDEWNKAVMLQHEKQIHEQSAFFAIAHKRKIEIALKKENRRIQNSIIDTVLIDLKKSLSEDFKDSKKSAVYLNSIVQFMNGKIS